MPKLTLTAEIRTQIDEILAPMRNSTEWEALELPFAPKPYAIVRMEGQPGTGKTALANYMARRMDKPPVHLNFSHIASSQLGETETKIVSVFNHAHETETNTIIMEECDAIFWSRDKISEDTMYMLGFINTMLSEIDRFIQRAVPSLLILTTNYPQLLDSALQRRITDVIKLFPPVGPHAERMWLSKLPNCMKTEMVNGQLKSLASLGATPDQMEKAVLKICRTAMNEGRKPTFTDFNLGI